jgi:hypothetical protein
MTSSTTRQSLPWLTLVIDQHMFAARHVMADGRDDFIFRDIFGDDAPRNLPFAVDPFDDPASVAPRLLQGRRHAASAHMERGLCSA